MPLLAGRIIEEWLAPKARVDRGEDAYARSKAAKATVRVTPGRMPPEEVDELLEAAGVLPRN